MANKSNTQSLLLGLCPPPVQERVLHSYSVKVESDVCLIDGFIFLYSKGNDLCNLRVNKQRNGASIAIPDNGNVFDSLRAAFGQSSGPIRHPDEMDHRIRPEKGVWSDLGSAFERIVRDAFATRGAKLVVLGFDKRQHISRAKGVAQARRREGYARKREAQIEKDTKQGVPHTQGIPFIFQSIRPSDYLPYPWSEIASNKSLLGIVVQYILHHHLIPRLDKISSPGQVLVLDGHNMAGILEGADNDVPLLIRHGKARITHWKALRNTVGEFDHCIYHYIYKMLRSKSTKSWRRFRVLSSDTDISIMAVYMIELLGDDAPTIDMQIPVSGKGSHKFNMLRVNRLVDGILDARPVLRSMHRPVTNLAFGLYLKANDYDDDEHYDERFFHKIGHTKILAAYLANLDVIGPLCKWDDEARLDRIRGEAVRKLVVAAYFQHYDQFKSDKARLYPEGTEFGDLTDLNDVREEALAKGDGKPCPPTVRDMKRKAKRIHFLATLYDDAVHGEATIEDRTILDEDMHLFGYEECTN